MKFLFDFDGVLTEQTQEAQRVREIFRGLAASAGGVSEGEVERLFQRAELEMRRAPHLHGWRSKGRLTAFANEDLFILNNGIASCLEDWAQAGDASLAPWKGRFDELAGNAYTALVEETRGGVHQPIDPLTRELLLGLQGKGHAIVVVSNSSTDRILHLLKQSGVQAFAHAADPRAPLRVRGDAKKFELGLESRMRPVGPYAVEVSRPSYEAILRDERPDFVIGDVFSLDLALPLHLSESEPGSFGGLTGCLKLRGYTPEWSIAEARRNPRLRTLGALTELLELA